MKNITVINAKVGTNKLIIILDGRPIGIASSPSEMREICEGHFNGLNPDVDPFPEIYVAWGRGANGVFQAAISIRGDELFS